VDNFDELKAKADEAKGKIVVFCEGFQNYGQAVRYRFSGASMAAAVGAVAALIYPPSPHSMYNPHTGMMEYIDSLPKIPIASLSAEDALLLERLYKRGQKPVVHIYMEAETLPDAPSYNVIAEIKGSEKPDDIIVMGGHSDSWDVGSGAHDDGGGIISTWEALRLIKKIGLKPKRTIRAVMFVNEENGVRGGKAYAEKHKMEKHSLVFEFDSGVFPPDKMQFQGQDSIFNAIKPIEAAFKGADSLQITKGGWGVDIGYMVRMGVPGLSLNTKDDGKYFWYHHANTDTPDKVDPKDLSRCVAAIASMIFIYSDLPFNFDTNNEILPNNKTK
ncbi:MAG: Peptidase protein, partial [Bacteroidota bacterium]|nr:Peptidase protein [Bacteroidota bacterium]